MLPAVELEGVIFNVDIMRIVLGRNATTQLLIDVIVTNGAIAHTMTIPSIPPAPDAIAAMVYRIVFDKQLVGTIVHADGVLGEGTVIDSDVRTVVDTNAFGIIDILHLIIKVENFCHTLISRGDQLCDGSIQPVLGSSMTISGISPRFTGKSCGPIMGKFEI